MDRALSKSEIQLESTNYFCMLADMLELGIHQLESTPVKMMNTMPDLRSLNTLKFKTDFAKMDFKKT